MLALIAPGNYLASLAGGGRKVVTTAGTRVQLVTSESFCEGVIIQALDTNTGFIAIAGSDVVAATGTRVGVVLAKNDSITIPIKDLSLVYLDATVSGEGVSYMPLR